MNKKKNIVWEIVIAILACIVFMTILFIVNDTTEKDATTTQQSTKATETATKDMFDKLRRYKNGKRGVQRRNKGTYR